MDQELQASKADQQGRQCSQRVASQVCSEHPRQAGFFYKTFPDRSLLSQNTMKNNYNSKHNMVILD